MEAPRRQLAGRPAGRAAVPALLLLAAASAALLAGLPAFTVPMAPSSPLGALPEEAVAPLPAARSLLPTSGGMASAASVAPKAQVVKLYHDYNRDKDDDEMHFGSKAYRHPAPIPKRQAGRKPEVRGTMQGFCDREYNKCYIVCKRYPKRRKLDCEFDCHRKRRTCYWNSRPAHERIREEFHEMMKVGRYSYMGRQTKAA
mmetsp:Transcript_37574/g.75744  ORF Transcript_37574/g.75744 Transcript_37574/m.75744 type:complete len:200 (-) Transcript_37574:117-716(-)